MTFEKVFQFICSILVVAFLGCVAYYGLAGPMELPSPDIINNFACFYSIFNVFNWATVISTLPLLLAAIYAGLYFAEKNAKIIFVCLEVAFVVIILLCGFGIIA